MSLAIVLLCAGASSRLGEPKQHTLIGGNTLLRDRAELACTVQQKIDQQFKPLVVCGRWFPEDQRLLHDLKIECVSNPAWEDGQLSSIHCGWQHRAFAEAVLVMLVDQYRVTASDLVNLVTAWQDEPDVPATAAYADTVGAPAIWPIVQRRELLTTGVAPKSLLQQTPHSAVNMPHAAWELDTPTDKQIMQEWHQQQNSRL